MSKCVVIGNGASRLDVDLPSLNVMYTYGCNAIYREYEPTVLVSTDPGMSSEIQNSGYSDTHIHYTRNPMPGFGSRKIEHNSGFSSGPVALTMAAMNFSTVYILGFDLNSNTGQINNVYAGTENYLSADAKPTYYGNWVNQVAKIMNDFGNTEFVRITDSIYVTPGEWNLQSNYSEMSFSDFKVMINNIKLK